MFNSPDQIEVDPVSCPPPEEPIVRLHDDAISQHVEVVEKQVQDCTMEPAQSATEQIHKTRNDDEFEFTPEQIQEITRLEERSDCRKFLRQDSPDRANGQLHYLICKYIDKMKSSNAPALKNSNIKNTMNQMKIERDNEIS